MPSWSFLNLSDLIQSISQSKFYCNKSQWITGCFGCQCRRTGETCIDFNDAIVICFGVESKLNITFTDDVEVTNRFLDRSCKSLISSSNREHVGATTILSPVWIPRGSTFSMFATVKQWSFLSRIISNSISFHPLRDSSTRIWVE